MWVPELFKFPLCVMQGVDLFVSVDVIVLVWLVPAIYVTKHEIKASSSRHMWVFANIAALSTKRSNETSKQSSNLPTFQPSEDSNSTGREGQLPGNQSVRNTIGKRISPLKFMPSLRLGQLSDRAIPLMRWSARHVKSGHTSSVCRLDIMQTCMHPPTKPPISQSIYQSVNKPIKPTIELILGHISI